MNHSSEDLPMLAGISRLFSSIRDGLAWLIEHPFVPIQLGFFYLIAWGKLGANLGMEDLFWSEFTSEQFFNGLACGLLFGEVLLVRYLLDRSGRFDLKLPVSLYPVRDANIEQLGRYLLVFWGGSLLFFGFKLFSADVWDGSLTVLPLYIGLATSLVLTSLLVKLFADWLTWIESIQKRYFEKREHPSLHAAAMLSALMSLLGVGVIYLLHFLDVTLPVFVVLGLMLGVLNAGLGLIAYTAPGAQYLVLITLVALGYLANLSKESDYKLSFPGLQNQSRIDLQNEDYFALLENQAAGTVPQPSLIDSEQPLREMKRRWQLVHPKQKPKIVLIATSGGGIRAAVWTGVVLEGLERELGRDFLGQIRLFTGASGGMVGGGFYVASQDEELKTLDPEDARIGLGKYSSLLSKESLRHPVQTMLLRDFPSIFIPGSVSWDRGREMERIWEWRTQDINGKSPFAKTFASLRTKEERGEIPSLIYSPMMVEDARRLFVSNLDLRDLTLFDGPILGKPVGHPKVKGLGSDLLSVAGVELFRLFPGLENEFRIDTAARMSASFPVVSPGVSLPTNPPRRLVDAGYFDNFGVDVAGLWMLRHEQAIRDNTSGVVLIEIRAYRNSYMRTHFQDRDKEPRNRDPLVGSLEFLSTPIEAILNHRERSPLYRNDALIGLLHKRFNDTPENQKDPFFVTIPFECEVDAALSWSLTRKEATAIAGAFTDPKEKTMSLDIRTRVKALKQWFGTGGK
jgi:hypothetical protein